MCIMKSHLHAHWRMATTASGESSARRLNRRSIRSLTWACTLAIPAGVIAAPSHRNVSSSILKHAIDDPAMTNLPGADLDHEATGRMKYRDVFHQNGCFHSVLNQTDEQKSPLPAGHCPVHPESTIEAPLRRCSEKFAIRN